MQCTSKDIVGAQQGSAACDRPSKPRPCGAQTAAGAVQKGTLR
jgi:hypothetical protein